MRVFFLLGVLAFLAVAVVFDLAAAAPTPCTISLTVADTSLEAEVTSTSPDAVVAIVNYTVAKPPSSRAVASFTATVDAGWVATVSPASITLTNQVAGTTTVTIVAPPGSRPSEPGTVTVVGRMSVAGIPCQDEADPIVVTPQP